MFTLITHLALLMLHTSSLLGGNADKYADVMPVLNSLSLSQDVFRGYEALSDSRLIIAIDLGWGPALVTVYQESSFCLNLKPETREKS